MAVAAAKIAKNVASPLAAAAKVSASAEATMVPEGGVTLQLLKQVIHHAGGHAEAQSLVQRLMECHDMLQTMVGNKRMRDHFLLKLYRHQWHRLVASLGQFVLVPKAIVGQQRQRGRGRRAGGGALGVNFEASFASNDADGFVSSLRSSEQQISRLAAGLGMLMEEFQRLEDGRRQRNGRGRRRRRGAGSDNDEADMDRLDQLLQGRAVLPTCSAEELSTFEPRERMQRSPIAGDESFNVVFSEDLSRHPVALSLVSKAYVYTGGSSAAAEHQFQCSGIVDDATVLPDVDYSMVDNCAALGGLDGERGVQPAVGFGPIHFRCRDRFCVAPPQYPRCQPSARRAAALRNNEADRQPVAADRRAAGAGAAAGPRIAAEPAARFFGTASSSSSSDAQDGAHEPGSFFAHAIQELDSFWNWLLRLFGSFNPTTIEDLLNDNVWTQRIPGLVLNAVRDVFDLNELEQNIRPSVGWPESKAIRIQGFNGRILDDGYSCYRAADDYGHSIHEMPAFVARLEPKNTGSSVTLQQREENLRVHADSVRSVIMYAKRYNDVQEQLVRDAAARGSPLARNCYKKVKVVARGADIFDTVKTAHSVWGQSQALDGIILEYSQANDVVIKPSPNGEYTLRVGAGCSWKQLVDECEAFSLQRQAATGKDYNYCVPITTTNLFLTIGGTLSVLAGEYATTTKGPATSFIEEMTVVTGEGRIEVCGPFSTGRLKRLYDAVRCGLGEYGVMVDVTFRLEQKPPVTYGYLAYTSQADAMNALRILNRHPLVDGTVMEVMSSIKFNVPIGDLLTTITAKPWHQMVIRLPDPGFIKSQLRRADSTSTDPNRDKFIYFVHAVCYAREVGQDRDGFKRWARTDLDDVMDQAVPMPSGVREFVPEPVQEWEEDMAFFEYKVAVDRYITVDQKYGSWNSPHAQVSAFIRGRDLPQVLTTLMPKYTTPEFVDTVLYLAFAPYRENFTNEDLPNKKYAAPGFMLPQVDPGEDIVLISTMSTVRDEVKAGGSKVDQRFADQLQRIQQITQDDIVHHTGGEFKCFPWGYIPYSWPTHYGALYSRQQRYKEEFDPQCLLGGCNVFDRPVFS